MILILSESYSNSAGVQGEEPHDLTDEEIEEGLLLVASSPSKFCTAFLGFTPFPYQMKVLEDLSKNIVICAARQVGKSKAIGARALWFAFVHANTATYIVAATQRQSMMVRRG